MRKNKGYTMIELIIVIAIMAILSGVTLLTMGIVRKAKFTTAVNTLNNEISSCLIRTRAISDVDETGGATGTDYPLCMVIRKRSNNAYVIMTGYYNGTTVTDVSGFPLDPEKNENCESVLPKEVQKIYYTPSGGTEQEVTDTFIQFVKSDGSVQHGAGTYRLEGGNSQTAKIVLDGASGKHYIK